MEHHQITISFLLPIQFVGTQRQNDFTKSTSTNESDVGKGSKITSNQ